MTPIKKIELFFVHKLKEMTTEDKTNNNLIVFIACCGYTALYLVLLLNYGSNLQQKTPNTQNNCLSPSIGRHVIIGGDIFVDLKNIKYVLERSSMEENHINGQAGVEIMFKDGKYLFIKCTNNTRNVETFRFLSDSVSQYHCYSKFDWQ